MDFDHYIDRYNTDSLKWDAYHRDYPELSPEDKLLPVWIADMDFKCPGPVIDAVVHRAEYGIYGYTTTNTDDFKQDCVQWLKRRYSYETDPEWILYTRGIIPGFNVAIQAFTNPGDGILITQPVYSPYAASISDNGRHVVNSELKPADGKYVIDFDDFEKKAALGSTKMFLMSNPHNPVGRVWTRKELSRIGEICVKHHVLIVSDEVHADLMMKGYHHTPIASISREFADITISCYAPSKTFNMAGLHTSYFVISNPVLRNEFILQHNRNRIWDINYFGAAALKAAYTQCDEWLEEVLVYIEGNIDYMQDYIEKNIPNIKMYRPEGTYLVWADFSGTGMSQAEFEHAMLFEAKLAVDFGKWFGENCGCCARFNLATPRSIVEDMMRRLEKAFASPDKSWGKNKKEVVA